jgi:hypothetical protein
MRTLHFQPPVRLETSIRSSHGLSRGAGRLIQILLALYLVPALLVVLLVGGIGMLVLAISRLVSTVNGIQRIAS